MELLRGRGSVLLAVLRLALSAVVERVVAPAAAPAVGLVEASGGGRVVEPVAGGHVPAGALAVVVGRGVTGVAVVAVVTGTVGLAPLHVLKLLGNVCICSA